MDYTEFLTADTEPRHLIPSKGMPSHADAPELVVLLGAGASSIHGIPDTGSLTNTVTQIADPQVTIPYPDYRLAGELVTSEAAVVPVVRLLNMALRGTFEEPNFELMLHAVESLEAFSAFQTFDDALSDIRPVLVAFTETSRRWDNLVNFPLLRDLRMAMLRSIVSTIGLAQDSTTLGVEEVEARVRFDSFLRALRSTFVVRAFTLDYDLLAEESGSWEDGYRDGDPAGAVFSRRRFLDACSTPRHTLCHLHGSINFGYRRKQAGMTKYPTWQAALESYHDYKGPKPDVSGELFESGPVISGLRKLDKLNSTPYAYYYNEFINAILRCQRLLIIGYGFNDPHINYWLSQHRTRHLSDERRVVIVDRIARLLRADASGMRTKHSILFKKRTTTRVSRRDGIEHVDDMLNAQHGLPLSESQKERILEFLLNQPTPGSKRGAAARKPSKKRSHGQR